jgi:hypothetical protein
MYAIFGLICLCICSYLILFNCGLFSLYPFWSFFSVACIRVGHNAQFSTLNSDSDLDLLTPNPNHWLSPILQFVESLFKKFQNFPYLAFFSFSTENKSAHNNFTLNFNLFYNYLQLHYIICAITITYILQDSIFFLIFLIWFNKEQIVGTTIKRKGTAIFSFIIQCFFHHHVCHTYTSSNRTSKNKAI